MSIKDGDLTTKNNILIYKHLPSNDLIKMIVIDSSINESYKMYTHKSLSLPSLSPKLTLKFELFWDSIFCLSFIQVTFFVEDTLHKRTLTKTLSGKRIDSLINFFKNHFNKNTFKNGIYINEKFNIVWDFVKDPKNIIYFLITKNNKKKIK